MSPLGILRGENHHYKSRPLAGRSCSVVAPPGQAWAVKNPGLTPESGSNVLFL
jgi:hypothetical protein